MKYAALIILIALIQYVWFTVRVGFSRGKYGVNAPKTTGDETWERIFRVQQNTLEQLIVFVPATVIFSTYLSARWVLIPGLIFIVGRQLYSHEYISKPESRVPGMSLSLLANAALLIGGAVGLAMKMM